MSPGGRRSGGEPGCGVEGQVRGEEEILEKEVVQEARVEQAE